jgi:predicted ABC-type ATPase
MRARKSSAAPRWPRCASRARRAALAKAPFSITVLAGVNGAGKSSSGGARLRAAGADYYNPDEAAREIRAANRALAQREANGLAWGKGRDLLRRAIDERKDFVFESTLGAHTIPAMLAEAADAGAAVHVWYVGLDAVERHLARVRSRVKAGGHDIPEADIRRRYETSRENLAWLMPKLAGKAPRPRLLLHLERGRIAALADPGAIPGWAKALAAKAMLIAGAQKR